MLNTCYSVESDANKKVLSTRWWSLNNLHYIAGVCILCCWSCPRFLRWFSAFSSVDIWSVGCIMAEMLQGKPLFKGSDRILLPHWPTSRHPAKRQEYLSFFLFSPLNYNLNYLKQLHCVYDLPHSTLDPWCSDLDQLTEIMKTTGTPTQEFIAKLESADVSSEHAGELKCDALPGFLVKSVCPSLNSHT